ncbi:hypothetical protein AB0M87_26340 [Streptomyces sp. NPDC051320]|uniref:hypothetical protein n=1 Tax=Streptomyces sp. NPDC051320 TaxID=3154644 RepID=UPI00341A6F6A
MALWVLVVWTGVQLVIHRGHKPVEALISGLFCAVFCTVWFLVRRRRDGRAVGTEPDAVPSLDRRIQKEDVPEDPAEREFMRLLIEPRANQLRRSGRWGLPLVVAMTVLLAVLFFILGSWVAGSCAIAGGAALFVFALWNRRRLGGRFARMEERLADVRRPPRGSAA